MADIACGTGILADRIVSELHPDEVYGVDMSDGMLAQARMRSSQVLWRKGPARQSAQPGTNPSPAEMRALFDGAGIDVSDQHRVRRPAWARVLSDLITVGITP